jgi:hypothetical protein
LGVHGAKSEAPVDQVQKCFQKALYAASLAAPYRHARLSAVKHIDQTDTIDGMARRHKGRIAGRAGEEGCLSSRLRHCGFGGIAAAGASGNGAEVEITKWANVAIDPSETWTLLKC